MSDAWWPEWLLDLASEDPLDLASEDPLGLNPVVVAEIEETPVDYKHYRQLFTALVPVEYVASVLEQPGGIGHDVSASGPHPGEFRASGATPHASGWVQQGFFLWAWSHWSSPGHRPIGESCGRTRGFS